MIRINLLPLDLRPQPKVKLVRVLALLAIVFAAAGAAGGIFWAWNYRQSLIHDLKIIEQKRIEYGPLYDKVIGMEATLGAIEAKLAGRRKLMSGLLDPVLILETMEGNVPESVLYANFTVGTDRRLAINGVATDYYGVAALMLRLSISGEYSEVRLGSASGEEGRAINFSLACALRGGTLAP
ncbi:MAG: PilN domain-containing protein [Bacteroidota bacterium]